MTILWRVGDAKNQRLFEFLDLKSLLSHTLDFEDRYAWFSGRPDGHT
jgi:hypothetical protein